MLWSEWANGATFTTASPLVVYNGTLYRCIAPYAKTADLATPDNLTDNFEEVTGSAGVTSYNDLTDVSALDGPSGNAALNGIEVTVSPA